MQFCVNFSLMFSCFFYNRYGVRGEGRAEQRVRQAGQGPRTPARAGTAGDHINRTLHPVVATIQGRVHMSNSKRLADSPSFRRTFGYIPHQCVCIHPGMGDEATTILSNPSVLGTKQPTPALCDASHSHTHVFLHM